MNADKYGHLQYSEYVLEESDLVEGEYCSARLLQYKDRLLGKRVPGFSVPGGYTIEQMQKDGHKDVRQYLVHSYLDCLQIEHAAILDMVL